MPGDDLRVSTVERVIGRGSGFSCVVRAESGVAYVMKMSGAGQGVFGLYHELVAMRIARAIGLRVPDAAPIWLDAASPWAVGTDEFDDALQRSAGWNLAIRFVAGARDVDAAALDALPETFVAALAVADAALVNVDRTRANPNLLQDAGGQFWAIDFGACLYWSDRTVAGADGRVALPSSHFLAGRNGRFTLPVLAPGVVAEIFNDIPEDWRVRFPQVAARARACFAGDNL